MPPQWGPLLPGQRPLMGKREIELGRAMHEQIEELVAANGYDITLHDNRTSTNRKRGEGTLFVGRDPFQVRSLAETGVSIRKDHETETLVVELGDPVSKPEYSVDAVRTDDIHELCICCYDVLNYFCKYREERTKFDATKPEQGAVFHLPNTIIHHANLFSLYAHANIGKCHICKIIIERVEYRWDLKHAQYGDYRLEMAFPQINVKDENDSLSFVMVRSDQKKYPVWNWTPLLRLKLWPEDKYGHHFEAFSQSDHLGSQRGESVQSTEGAPTSRPPPNELAAVWLTQCMANQDGKHMPCRRENPGYLPTRLLDVRHALKRSKLRIVCPQDDPTRFLTHKSYATLSHCWGSWGAAENPSLTEANLELRKEDGLSCDRLPATFYDAITVCTWLEIPYLWIDSLCIIQDSHRDWIHEASVMHHTYQFGTVNISAACGNDSRSGLFAKRDYEAFSLQRFQAPRIPRTWSVTSDDMFAWTNTASAFSRAWIHRERQIAPRILHFTPEGMVVWECCGTDGVSFKSESLPGGAPFEGLWYGNTKFQTPTMLLSSKKGTEATYAIWHDMCEKFSTKNLTAKSDMPVILSSLAEDFQKLLPNDEYLAGMWRNTLPQSLVWHTHRYWPERDTSKIAPTWSWLSAPAPIGVKFLEKTKMEQLIPLAKVVDVDIVPEEGYENNKYGPVKSGTLRLEGFMRMIWLDFDEDDKFQLAVVDTLVDGDEDDHEKSRLRVVGKSWEEYEGEVCEVNLDGAPADDEYCCWCMFTSIEEWVNDDDWSSQDRTVTAILLERLGDENNESWVRIGTIKMHEMIAFKMRYKDCWEWDPTRKSEDFNEDKAEKEDKVVDPQAGHERNQKKGGERYKSDEDEAEQDACSEITSTDETSASIKQILSDDGLLAHGRSDIHDAEVASPITFKNPVSKTNDDPTTVGSGDNTDGDRHQDQVAEPDKDANSPSSSQSSDSIEEDIWTNLSKIIKYDRYKVAQLEKVQRRKQRDAEKALKKNSEAGSETGSEAESVSGEDYDRIRHSTLKKEEEKDVPGAMSEGATTEKTDINTPDATVESTPKNNDKANLDASPASTSYVTDSTPKENNTDIAEDPMSSGDNANVNIDHKGLPTPNSPPVHGFTNIPLTPLQALYQFDGVITEYHEQGKLNWLRRLDVRTIEIV